MILSFAILRFGDCSIVMSFELMDSLLLRSEIEAPTSVDDENEGSALGDLGSEITSVIFLDSDSEESRSGVSSIMAATYEGENWLHSTDGRQLSEDGSLLLVGDPNLDGLSMVSDASSLCGLEVKPETGMPFADVESSRSDVELISNTSESLSVAVDSGEEIVDGSSSRPSMDVVPLDFGSNGRASRSIFEVSYVPLWGFTSVPGRRADMEDAVSIVPNLVEIPLQMLVDRPPDGLTSRVTHLTGHFFGVFDGHGGAKVCISSFFQYPHIINATHQRRNTLDYKDFVFRLRIIVEIVFILLWLKRLK